MDMVIITDAWEPQVNGVVRTYQNLSHELKNMGHEIKIISPQDFKTWTLPFYPEIQLSKTPYKKLASILDQHPNDTIHIAVEGPLGWAARRYCKKHNRPYTTSFHTHFPDYIAERLPSPFKAIAHKIAFGILRHFHNAAHQMYVATQSLENELKKQKFTSPMTRMTRGVNLDVFHPTAHDAHHNNNTKPQKPILLYVGRIATEKNIRAFLDIDMDAHKIVVGHGPDLAALQKHYPDVEFAGLQQGEDLAHYYRKSDCFVFPSKTDTFGIVLIEALACGTPVAGYPVTGPRDIINHPILGATNFDLKKAIEQALQSPGTAQDRYHHVQKNYSWRKNAEIFIQPHLP